MPTAGYQARFFDGTEPSELLALHLIADARQHLIARGVTVA